MSKTTLAKEFARLPERERLMVLAEWACEMTVAARGTYVPDAETVQEPEKLRRFNELLHRITRQVQQFIQRNSQRYPDELFVEMVDDAAKELGCQKQLKKAMERALAFKATEMNQRATA